MDTKIKMNINTSLLWESLEYEIRNVYKKG